jgi:hypothetical protein
MMNKCMCGCDEEIPLISKLGTPQKYKHGHNPRGISILRDCISYREVKCQDHRFANSKGYIKKHRLVYEESRNCCLLPWADCHHKDGNKLNNIWYNLQPFSIGQHTSIEHKGVRLSEITRKRMSESRKGMRFTEEHRKNLSLSHRRLNQ